MKSAEALETARGVKTVVLDKTGTITKGAPQVTDVLPAEGVRVEELLQLAYALEKPSEHPLARAMVLYAAGGIGADAVKESAELVSGFEQVPGQGVSACVSGAACYAGNARMMAECGIAVDASQAEGLADEGKTVTYFACDGKLVGIIAVADVPKATSAAAIAQLRAMGIRTVMLTAMPSEPLLPCNVRWAPTKSLLACCLPKRSVLFASFPRRLRLLWWVTASTMLRHWLVRMWALPLAPAPILRFLVPISC